MFDIALSQIEGARIRLRLVEPGDANYVLGLRTDQRYNRYLSAVTGSVEDQRAWIEAYKLREAHGTELYYLIERLSDDRPCGLVRIYDILPESFTWGSWILNEDKPAKAALDSALLVYRVGFEILGKPCCTFDVRKDNKRALSFHRRFGGIETSQTDNDVLFELKRSFFMRRVEKLAEALR